MSLDRPGFGDPVADAQSCFRAVLEAMSHPGRVVRAGEDLAPPAPLDPATAAVLLTLADHDTALFLPPEAAPAADWIAFHCGAPLAQQIGAAEIVLGFALPDLGTLDAGTHEVPERGATLILQLPALGSGAALRLSGPGLAASEILRVSGLPGDFAARWAASRAQFPCGIDLILCSGTTLATLPRSVTVEAA